jgi:hypothetical protein
MGNIQVAGVLKRVITKVSMMGTEISDGGHYKQPPRAWEREKRKQDKLWALQKANRAWWKKGRPREKVCAIKVIWLWGIVNPRFELLRYHFTLAAN